MVAVHVAHGRQPWTSCRRPFTSERRSSRFQDGRTSAPETRSQACLPRSQPAYFSTAPRRAGTCLNSQTCSLRATPACCNSVSLALRIYQHSSASSQRKPRYRLCLPYLWACPQLCLTCNRICLCWFFRQVRNFALACILDSRPRIICDEDSPFAEDFMGPRANLRMEPGRSSREPPLDYQR